MHYLKIAVITSVYLFINGYACAQRLELFTSESGKVMNNGIAEPVPYYRVVTYYDLLNSEHKPDTVLYNKGIFYLYFRLPTDVTEIGVRFISPVPSYVYPGPGDIETAHYSNKVQSGFLAEMMIEHLDNSDSTWYMIESNMTRGISAVTGEPSVIRVVRNPLPQGLYRVGFHPAKAQGTEMSFMMSLGLIPAFKGIRIGRTVSDLSAQD